MTDLSQYCFVDSTHGQLNYLRLCWIISSIASSFVRRIFDVEFCPATLPATLRRNFKKLNDLKRQKIIKEPEYRLLNSVDGTILFLTAILFYTITF